MIHNKNELFKLSIVKSLSERMDRKKSFRPRSLEKFWIFLNNVKIHLP